MTKREKQSGPPLPAPLQEQLVAWRRAHPTATLAEMEDGVREILNALRSQMLEHLAGEAVQPVQLCPSCGERMQRRGTRTRAVVTEGDQVAEVERPYWTCPRCELGLFPPG